MTHTSLTELYVYQTPFQLEITTEPKKRWRTLLGKCLEVREDEGIIWELPGAVCVPYLRSFTERLLLLSWASAIETGTD